MRRDPGNRCDLFIFLYLIQRLDDQCDPAAVDVSVLFDLEDDFAGVLIDDLLVGRFENRFGKGGYITANIHDDNVSLLLQFNVGVFFHNRLKHH